MPGQGVEGARGRRSGRADADRERGGSRKGRAGGVGTANVGGGFSSTSANKARAARAGGPLKAAGLNRSARIALGIGLPGIGVPDLAASAAKAIGPVIQGAFEGILGGKGTAPAIDTSDTRITGASPDRGSDRRRRGSKILLADALGEKSDVKDVKDVKGDNAAKQVRVAAKKRRGRRASILSNISEDEAQSTSINRPGAGTLAKIFGS